MYDHDVSETFPFSVGQIIEKRQIHRLLGGSDQHGMTSCLNGTAFLVFHNEAVGKKFGYDRWEGWQADGSFHYTGQGVQGHQKLTRSNKSLHRMGEVGNPIHLFHTDKKGNPYIYIGLMSLGEPQFFYLRAPDKFGEDRQVIVFHLLPIGKVAAHPENIIQGMVKVIEGNWASSSIIDQIIPSGPTATPAQIDLEEMKLQSRFGNYLKAKGESVKTISISVDGQKGSLKPDFFLDERNWIVEAKPSSSREHVRLAIGQVLDYSHLLEKAHNKKQPAILLPMAPPDDLLELLTILKIHLIYETELGHFVLPS